MANKVKFGLDQVYIAMLTEATGVYAAPLAIPGAVTLGLDPEGDLTRFYADNMAYFTMATNNGYNGDLQMALVPDAVLADILGWETDDNGMLVEISDAQPQPFALLYQVLGNEFNKRYVFYRCVASRPKEDHTTTSDKVEPATDALSLVCMPIEIDDRKVVKGAIERSVANAVVFDAFYTAVLEPSFAVS